MEKVKFCSTCKYTGCHPATIFECATKDGKYWEDSKGVEKDLQPINSFVDGELVTNSQGGKQSKIETAFSLVPHDSLLTVAKVMKIGSERYAKDNWRKLSTDEIYDHLMEHLVNWHLTGNMEDLEHGMTRAMMLYSVANDGQ